MSGDIWIQDDFLLSPGFETNAIPDSSSSSLASTICPRLVGKGTNLSMPGRLEIGRWNLVDLCLLFSFASLLWFEFSRNFLWLCMRLLEYITAFPFSLTYLCPQNYPRYTSVKLP